MGTKRDKARDKKVAKWDKNRGSGNKVGQDKGQRKQSGKRPRREKIKWVRGNKVGKANE